MPHTLKLPERLTAVGLFSGTVPFDLPSVRDGINTAEAVEFSIAYRLPWHPVRQMWKPSSVRKNALPAGSSRLIQQRIRDSRTR